MALPIKLNLPEDFLKEEVICGHTVTEKNKKVWAVELDLLNELQEVCKRHKLRWYIAYGSMIGTVRHKGFIPWDNDIDVLMPRSDFRKLCEIAPKEFKQPYFLSYAVSENGNRFSTFAKLCNSLTTGGSEDMWLQGVNCGLFVDIFILDEIPDDDAKARKMVNKVNYICHFARFLSPYKTTRKGLQLIKHLYFELAWHLKYRCCKGDKLFMIIDEICRTYEGKGYKRLCFIEGKFNPLYAHSHELWNDVIEMPFEMLHVPIPARYDTILRNRYGDYMLYPSIEARITHPYLDMEPEIPYQEFYSNRSK